MFKKCVFALFFLLTVQGISCTSPNDYDDQVFGLIEEFNKIIESLKKAIFEAIEDAKNQLRAIYDKLISFADSVIAEVTKQLDEIIGHALTEIKEMKEKAEELGIDVTECLAENEQQIHDLPKKLLANLGDCINVQIQEAEAIITKTLTEISVISDIIDQLKADFQNCPSGLSGVVCVGKVIAKAGMEIAQIPLKVGQQITKAIQLIATIQTDLTICGSTQVAIAAKEAGKLVLDISRCISDKIGQEL